jgi:hypothetical protein
VLKRNTTLGSTRLNIHKIDGIGNNLGPKLRRMRGGDYQHANHMKMVKMLALSSTILSMRTRTRD